MTPQRPLVLFVEDHPVQQKIITLLAARMGFEAEVVDNCAHALEALESGTQYSLICMDLSLRDAFDGLECTRRIRIFELNSGPDNHTPIIALTARAMPEDRQRCLDAGMDDYLPKPFTIEQLDEMIQKWLR